VVTTVVVNFVVKLTTVVIVLIEVEEPVELVELVVLEVVEVTKLPYVNVADPVTGVLCADVAYTAVTV
jgi:hypothetical protein